MKSENTSGEDLEFAAAIAKRLESVVDSGNVLDLEELLVACKPQVIDAARFGAALGRAVSRRDPEIVEILIAHGADPNFHDKHGSTPLVEAMRWGYTNVASALIRLGAETSITERGTAAPIHYVRDLCMLEILLEGGADIEAQDEEGRTALIRASACGYEDVVQRMISVGAKIDAKDNYGTTALIHASINGQTATVSSLLKHGAHVDVNNNDGLTALIAAAAGGHTEIVNQLLLSGANVNAKLKDGNTAIYGAARNGHSQIVELLALGGAEIDSPGVNGITPLMAAARSGHLQVVVSLVRYGADMEKADRSGLSVVGHAATHCHHEIVRWLAGQTGNE